MQNSLLLQTLETYHFNGKKIRLGSINDGGYVIADVPIEYDCYISAGVSNEESFTRDFLTYYNNLFTKNNSFAFDGTIHDYPYSFTKEITFFKKNIDEYNTSSTTNLQFLIKKYETIFLKMDIEGSEFPWLSSLNEDDLEQFAQIVIEMHEITTDSMNTTLQDKITCLQKLAKTHYLIHAHGNNYGKFNEIPDVLELTYVRKNLFNYNLKKNTTPFPILDLDYPNAPFLPDYNLTYYPFFFGNCYSRNKFILPSFLCILLLFIIIFYFLYLNEKKTKI